MLAVSFNRKPLWLGTWKSAVLAVLAVFWLLVLGGCAPTGTPTAAATMPAVSLPAAGDVTAYPAPADVTVPGVETSYPAGPGILGVPAIENLSRISARLIESAPDENRPDSVRLRVEVLSSAALEGMPEFTAGRVGEQIDLLATAQGLPNLVPGDRLQADVRYEGDERGGMFYASQIEKLAP